MRNIDEFLFDIHTFIVRILVFIVEINFLLASFSSINQQKRSKWRETRKKKEKNWYEKPTNYKKIVVYMYAVEHGWKSSHEKLR